MKFWVLFLCAALAGLGSVALFGAPESSVNQRLAQELKMSLREEMSARRNLFFGHREFSDLLTALDILSNTVDVISTPQSERTQKRFERSLADIAAVARFQLGMNEIFLFPANHLLFDLNLAQNALNIIDLGLTDPRATPQMPLMAGFIAHVFLRDTHKAAGYYKGLSLKPNVPPWVADLSAKLELGNDPFVTDSHMAQKLCKLVRTIFPQSEKVIAATHPECLGGVEH